MSEDKVIDRNKITRQDIRKSSPMPKFLDDEELPLVLRPEGSYRLQNLPEEKVFDSHEME